MLNSNSSQCRYSVKLTLFLALIMICVSVDARMTPAMRMDMANAYYRDGLYEQALHEFEVLLEVTGPFPALYNNIGLVWMEKGHLSNGEKYFRKALSLDPEFSDSLNNLGLLYIRKGRIREAVFTLQRAVRNDPEKSEYHESLSRAYEEAGLMEQAAESCFKAIELKECPLLWRKYGILLGKTGAYEEALSALRNAIDLDASRVLPWLDMLELHYIRRETARAQMAFDSLLRAIDRTEPHKEDMQVVKQVFLDWYASALLHLARSFYGQDNPDWSQASGFNLEELQSRGYLANLHPDADSIIDAADITIDENGVPVSKSWSGHPYARDIVSRISRRRLDAFEEICRLRRNTLDMAWTLWGIFQDEHLLELNQRLLLEEGFISQILSCPQGGAIEGARGTVGCSIHGR